MGTPCEQNHLEEKKRGLLLNCFKPLKETFGLVNQSVLRPTTPYTFRDSINKLTITQPGTNYLGGSVRYSGAAL